MEDRERCKLMKAHVRWVPTNRMLADAFTKDVGDPMGLLRSCLTCGLYQISAEETVLENQAIEKKHRLQRRTSAATEHGSKLRASSP